MILAAVSTIAFVRLPVFRPLERLAIRHAPPLPDGWSGKRRAVEAGLKWAAFLLPLAAALYTGMTISPALRHASGKGGAWRGRTYPV